MSARGDVSCPLNEILEIFKALLHYLPGLPLIVAFEVADVFEDHIPGHVRSEHGNDFVK